MLVSLAVKLKVSLQIGLVVAQLAEVVTTDEKTHLENNKILMTLFFFGKGKNI